MDAQTVIHHSNILEGFQPTNKKQTKIQAKGECLPGNECRSDEFNTVLRETAGGRVCRPGFGAAALCQGALILSSIKKECGVLLLGQGFPFHTGLGSKKGQEEREVGPPLSGGFTLQNILLSPRKPIKSKDFEEKRLQTESQKIRKVFVHEKQLRHLKKA